MVRQYVIEKNVAIPEARGGGRRKGELRLTIELMNVGESIFVTGKSRSSLSSIGPLLKPKKFITREEGNGFRIWRVR